jgi:hypothetical protein
MAPVGRQWKTKFFQPSESAVQNLMEAGKNKKSGHIWFNSVKFGQIWSNFFNSRVTRFRGLLFFFGIGRIGSD